MHVPTSCFVALWKYLCPYVFLWSLLFKCPESIFSLSHPLPLLSPHLCVRWCQRWWRENSAHWEENSVSIWFACSTFISLPVLSCCGCDALSSLHISIHVSFFLLSLVACILQSFQTVSFMLLRHNSRPQGCSWCALHHWYVRCQPRLGLPRLLHSLQEVITRKVFSTEFRCCTLLQGTFFAPL